MSRLRQGRALHIQSVPAVRRALEALAAEGYAEAELDRIGVMEGQPDEEPHASAWQGATEGEIAIVTFDEDF